MNIWPNLKSFKGMPIGNRIKCFLMKKNKSKKNLGGPAPFRPCAENIQIELDFYCLLQVLLVSGALTEGPTMERHMAI